VSTRIHASAGSSRVKLPLPCGNDLFAVAPDGRTIYCGGQRSEADIGIVERGQ
jgi:hypothetical protein